MVRLCLVIRRLLPLDDRQVLCVRAQGVLHEHLIFSVIPSVQALLYQSSDSMECGDMSGSLQYQHLEDDELNYLKINGKICL